MTLILTGLRRVRMPDGRMVQMPSVLEREAATRLTKRQEELYDRMMKLPAGEQGDGEAASIKRKVVTLEMRKHELLRIGNELLLGD